MNFIHKTGIIVFMCIASISAVGACGNCTVLDFTKVQLACSYSFEELQIAESKFANNDASRLCDTLFRFYYCVGENVPVCLTRTTESYVRYYSSPYDCHPPPEVIQKLQSYCLSNGPPTQHSKMEDTTMKYNVISTAQNSSMGKHTSLNATNFAPANIEPHGTFLLALTGILSWYLDVV